jgi:hypothetical protein
LCLSHCPKPGPKFATSYVMVFYCVLWVQLRWEVIVSFVEIDGIDDRHCLNFLKIMSTQLDFLWKYWILTIVNGYRNQYMFIFQFWFLKMFLYIRFYTIHMCFIMIASFLFIATWRRWRCWHEWWWYCWKWWSIQWETFP